MNAIIAEAESLTETPAIEAPEDNGDELGEFKIVIAEKRTVKSTCAGQVIEVLKRAKAPLTLKALTSRVKSTKVGKTLTVKDVKARVRSIAEWYVKDEEGFIEKTDEGEYFLARVRS